MQTVHNYALTKELLQRYCIAALHNATELLEEASLLLANGHHARAYFLAVAAIEETGKAHMAFDAQGRNVTDSAVAAKIRKSFGDHSAKINQAFVPWILGSQDLKTATKAAINLMLDLKVGREPSMYTDVHIDGAGVAVPSLVVQPEAAADCVRLAINCHAHALRHVQTAAPTQTTTAQDKLFAMKRSDLMRMMNTEGFWWYHIARLKRGEDKFEDSVTEYFRDFFQKSREFVRPLDEE